MSAGTVAILVSEAVLMCVAYYAIRRNNFKRPAPPPAAVVPTVTGAPVPVLPATHTRLKKRSFALNFVAVGVTLNQIRTNLPDINKQIAILIPHYDVIAPKVTASFTIFGFLWLAYQWNGDRAQTSTQEVDKTPDAVIQQAQAQTPPPAPAQEVSNTNGTA